MAVRARCAAKSCTWRQGSSSTRRMPVASRKPAGGGGRQSSGAMHACMHNVTAQAAAGIRQVAAFWHVVVKACAQPRQQLPVDHAMIMQHAGSLYSVPWSCTRASSLSCQALSTAAATGPISGPSYTDGAAFGTWECLSIRPWSTCRNCPGSQPYPYNYSAPLNAAASSSCTAGARSRSTGMPRPAGISRSCSQTRSGGSGRCRSDGIPFRRLRQLRAWLCWARSARHQTQRPVRTSLTATGLQTHDAAMHQQTCERVPFHIP
jgi:hypothetical protein